MDARSLLFAFLFLMLMGLFALQVRRWISSEGSGIDQNNRLLIVLFVVAMASALAFALYFFSDGWKVFTLR